MARKNQALEGRVDMDIGLLKAETTRALDKLYNLPVKKAQRIYNKYGRLNESILGCKQLPLEYSLIRERIREVISTKYGTGETFTSNEIARYLNISPKSVGSYLNRSLDFYKIEPVRDGKNHTVGWKRRAKSGMRKLYKS